MKRIVTFALLTIFFGCFVLLTVFCFYAVDEPEIKPKPVQLVKTLKVSNDLDSIYIYDDGHIVATTKDTVAKSTQRYFLITYQYALKEFEGIYVGDVWFSADDFPSKNKIDRIIYNGLPRKRSCYQPIIISSIFEFRNEDDFLKFGHGYTGNRSRGRKLSCN